MPQARLSKMPIQYVQLSNFSDNLLLFFSLASTRTNVFPPYFRLKQVYVSKMVSMPVRLSEIG